MDLNYNGPDEGECNHRPDFIEGIGCEPNFAVTDIQESDMIGLTYIPFDVGYADIPITLVGWPNDETCFGFQMAQSSV